MATIRAHNGQSKILQSHARFIIFPAGRRSGKTLCAAMWLLQEAQRLTEQGYDPSSIILYWTASSWEHCKRGYSAFSRASLEQGDSNPLHELYDGGKKSYGDMLINLKGGYTIHFQTSGRPEQVEGEGIHAAIVDEAGHVKDDFWYESLKPTLAMSNGRALITGTPKGRNFFHDLYIKGQDPKNDHYESFRFPSNINPHLPDGYVEREQRDMPQRTFQQEIMAEFVDDSGGVFNNVRSLITTNNNYRGPDKAQGWKLQPPQPNTQYVAGWDPAKHQDYSTLITLRLPERHVAHVWREQGLGYDEQIQQVSQHLRRYNNATVRMDSGGVGDPLLDMLRQEYNGGVKSFKFTNARKSDLVNKLALHIDQGTVSYPDLPALVNELEIFEYETTPSGNTRYQAPEGHHDDLVDALALSVYESDQSNISVHESPDLDSIFETTPTSPDKMQRYR